MITVLPEDASDSKIQNKLLNCNTFTISMPPGCPGGFTDPGETVKFDSIGYSRNHAVLKHLEAKNLLKRAKIPKNACF